MIVSTRFSRKLGGRINTALSEKKRVSVNDILPFAKGGSVPKGKALTAARKKPGGSNVGKKRKTSGAGKGPFVGPSGGAPKGSFPVTNKKQWAAAKSYARNAPNPGGIKAAADRIAKRRGWLAADGGVLDNISPIRPSSSLEPGNLPEQLTPFGFNPKPEPFSLEGFEEGRERTSQAAERQRRFRLESDIVNEPTTDGFGPIPEWIRNIGDFYGDDVEFAAGGSIQRQDLPHIGPGKTPGRVFAPRGKTLSRVADEVPIRGSKKINAYNFRRGRPFTKLERFKRKIFPDGGVLGDQGVAFRPSQVREQLPGITDDQINQLILGAGRGGQGTVSDTIQYNVPQFDPNQVGSQQRVPINFETPSSQFNVQGVPLGGVPADRRIAPIRKDGGKLRGITINTAKRKKCGGKMDRFSRKIK